MSGNVEYLKFILLIMNKQLLPKFISHFLKGAMINYSSIAVEQIKMLSTGA